MLLLFRLVNQVAKNTITSLLVNDKYATNCRSDQLTTTNCRFPLRRNHFAARSLRRRTFCRILFVAH